MQENPAHQLHIKRPQAQGALGSLAAIRKRFRQQRVKAFAPGNPLLELGGFRLDALIAQRRKLRLQRVDLCHQRAHRLDHAVIRRSKHLPRQRSKTQHVFSARSVVITGIDKIV